MGRGHMETFIRRRTVDHRSVKVREEYGKTDQIWGSWQDKSEEYKS